MASWTEFHLLLRSPQEIQKFRNGEPGFSNDGPQGPPWRFPNGRVPWYRDPPVGRHLVPQNDVTPRPTILSVALFAESLSHVPCRTRPEVARSHGHLYYFLINARRNGLAVFLQTFKITGNRVADVGLRFGACASL